ncbi:uncharacterized protein Z518_03039 [Rhinocladiella mackenziei CBS 650.93]|uniref:Ser/arg-related nuclear matrix protein n=1 Tax=Rhinocladiella mackenziei CBS 650.93 TaxID=1442369 RepID=A0A0D2HD29_9EURO|nr:uncharacterized protein Z518_03039 [Rhinocladiella mackenziei CBS 650.93]KIX08383.1 hypothetical protein Z518_03039 [Rhinocladiella mackenziei CBS 650.93]
MTQIWPPSPCVEDEEVSLAKEYLVDVPSNQLKSENQPAHARGSVDQYPVIVDSHVPASTSKSNGQTANQQNDLVSDDVSSKECHEPAPPPVVNTEKRFVYIASKASEPEPISRSEKLQRSKSTTQLADLDVPRGRPQVTKIHTDLGGGLEGMVTGHRRSPSPYALKPPTPMDGLSASPHPKDKLLSPMHAHETRRPASVHRKTHHTEHDSSDSDHKSKQRRRPERSRSRPGRQSFSHSDRSETEKTDRSRTSKRGESPDSKFSRRAHRHRSPAPPPGGFVGYSYTGQDHITPPQTPKLTSDSARSSGVDQSTVHDSSGNQQPVKRFTADSPYTSSAEEGYSRRPGSGDERRAQQGGRSPRNSRSHMDKEDRPRLTRTVSQRRERGSKDEPNRPPPSSDERPRREPQTPLSARTTKAVEDYFEKAFIANQNKRSSHGDHPSRPVSPLASPPQSPPRTPRGEGASRDYFEQPSTTSKSSKQRSRPPSFDDGHFKDLKPLTSLLGAATLGASLAAKAIPNLSRPNTSLSTETPSSGSQSRPSSGQRSRKPSPVPEEPRTAPHTRSRTNSFTTRDDGKSTRTSIYSVHEDRAIPKSATYPPPPPPPLEVPRPTVRAASYSYSPEHPRPAAHYRTFSHMSSPSNQSTSGFQQPLQFPAHPAMLSSPMTSEPTGSFSGAISRPATLPPCPRSRPVPGLHDWYTIRDISYLDFCPTCMSFLGATRFRDYFIPSLPKDPRRPIVCAMSLPWLRFAWVQSIKQDRKDLTLVWQLSTPPPQETRPCAGSNPDVRRWYHLTDPRTRRPVEGFDICSACVRNIDLIFPKLQFHLFDRPPNKPSQEKVCNLNVSSRHFLPILNELERLAERRQKEQLRQKDLQDFVDFIRRISRHRECVKDTMLATLSWHYHPDLPELTICEECFEEIVWPLRDRPIARDVSKTLKPVPTLRRSQLLPGISCQLYSDRMRRIFHEAVNKNDFESLKMAARYRYNMEHRLQEMHKLYEQDQKAGIDRRAEMEKNISIWKSIE